MKGFKIIKLESIIKFMPKSNLPASEGKETGKYNFYTSSEKIKKCDFSEYDGTLCIVLGNGGRGSLFLDKSFSCSDHNFVFCAINESVTCYVYYYLKCNWNKVLNLFHGSTIGHLGKEDLCNLEIPIPEDINVIKIYLDCLNPCSEEIMSLKIQCHRSEKSICGIIKMSTTMGINGIDYDEYVLSDVCSIKAGPYIKKYELGIYPVIGGGNASKYTNVYNHSDSWIIHKDGISTKIISYISGNFFLNHHGWLLKPKFGFDITYIGYYISSETNNFLKKARGSVQTGLNQMNFYKTPIRILKQHIIQKYGLDKKFELINILRDQIQQTSNVEEETTKNLMNAVLDTTINSSDSNINLSDSEQKL